MRLGQIDISLIIVRRPLLNCRTIVWALLYLDLTYGVLNLFDNIKKRRNMVLQKKMPCENVWNWRGKRKHNGIKIGSS